MNAACLISADASEIILQRGKDSKLNVGDLNAPNITDFTSSIMENKCCYLTASGWK